MAKSASSIVAGIGIIKQSTLGMGQRSEKKLQVQSAGSKSLWERGMGCGWGAPLTPCNPAKYQKHDFRLFILDWHETDLR